MRIEITKQYGFAHYWTLVYRSKSYYLGQDVKFCTRVLHMEPRDVVQAIGGNDLSNEKTNKALARFIVQTLKPNNLQPWDLCAE